MSLATEPIGFVKLPFQTSEEESINPSNGAQPHFLYRTLEKVYNLRIDVHETRGKVASAVGSRGCR